MRFLSQQLRHTMTRTSRQLAACVLMSGLALTPFSVHAHCQVPCGIYDDHARVVAMAEDAATVKKAVTMMQDLAGKTDLQSQQQFSRWVSNKESHAQKIILTMADYFLTQRVKASQADYSERLIKHHSVIVAAMKAKQKSDPATVDALIEAIQALAPYYPDSHQH